MWGECSSTPLWHGVKRGRVHLLRPLSSLAAANKTILSSSLAPVSPRTSALAAIMPDHRGLNRKQPGLVCASAVIKRGAKKGINDLIEE